MKLGPDNIRHFPQWGQDMTMLDDRDQLLAATLRECAAKNAALDRMTYRCESYEAIFEQLRAEIECLTERCDAYKRQVEDRAVMIDRMRQEAEDAKADALRLHGEKMAYVEAAIELVHAETIKNVCGWYPQIEAFRKLISGHAANQQSVKDTSETK